jgi:hypothetical protein
MCAAQPPVCHGVSYPEKPEPLAAAAASHCGSDDRANFSAKLEPLHRSAARLVHATATTVVEPAETPTPMWCARNGVFPTWPGRQGQHQRHRHRLCGHGHVPTASGDARPPQYMHARDLLPPHKLCRLSCRRETGDGGSLHALLLRCRPSRSIRTTFISSCLLCV